MAYRRRYRRYKKRTRRVRRTRRKGKMWSAGRGVHSAYSCREPTIQRAMWG